MTRILASYTKIFICSYHLLQRNRIRLIRMEATGMEETNTSKALVPPIEVRGMLHFDSEKFRKVVFLTYFPIPKASISNILKSALLRRYIFHKMPKFKGIMDSDDPTIKHIFFDPDSLTSKVKENIVIELCSTLELERNKIKFKILPFEMLFKDWGLKNCIDAVLPSNLRFSGYTQIGHIIQLNLREELLPYKFVLAQILLEKIISARTVINKVDLINNEYRLLDSELLAGDPTYETEAIEHGIRYKLDFSKVFWNSRLSNVHHAITKKFDSHSVVFDVFAGIGPFVLPAVKHRDVMKAFANDLNPVCIEYLKENIKINKIASDRIETFNLEGSDFIKSVIPKKFATLSRSYSGMQSDKNSLPINFHCVMNLPTLSLIFLQYFKGIFNEIESRKFANEYKFYIHCHFFVKASSDETPEWFKRKAEELVKEQISDLIISDLWSVRSVAGRKEMFCASFLLPPTFSISIFDQKSKLENKNSFDSNIAPLSESPPAKLMKTSK